MIHNYSYKPEPEIGYKNDRESREHLTFGVELECEPRNDGGNVRMDAYELSDRIDEIPGGRTYCKSDGSLSNGVEIVSHPGTLAHHMYVMHWRQIQRTCEKAGFRSHDAANSGLHVHVGRAQLGSTDAERDDVTRKVQVLFALYTAELTRFSRRRRSCLEQWAPIDRLGVTPDDIRHVSSGAQLASWAHARVPAYRSNHNDRYTAVNVTNSATVEIRIFRGTLKRDTLIAAIQLVSNVFEYAMAHDWADIPASTWADVAAYKPHKELVNYMIARGLLDADAAPETLPASNRPSDFYGVDGIARPAHA
jgi:hypothetical protein